MRSWVPWIACVVFSFCSGLARQAKFGQATILFLALSIISAGFGIWLGFKSAELERKALPELLALVLIEPSGRNTQASFSTADVLKELHLRILASNRSEIALVRSEFTQLLTALDCALRTAPGSFEVAARALALYRLLVCRLQDGPARISLPRGALTRIGNAILRFHGDAAAAAAARRKGHELAEDGVIALGGLLDVEPEPQLPTPAGAAGGDASAGQPGTFPATRLSEFSQSDVAVCMEALQGVWEGWLAGSLLHKLHWCAWSCLATVSAALTRSARLAAAEADGDATAAGDAGAEGDELSRTLAIGQRSGVSAEQVEGLALLVARTLQQQAQVRMSGMHGSAGAAAAALQGAAGSCGAAGGGGSGSSGMYEAPSPRLPELCTLVAALLYRANPAACARAAAGCDLQAGLQLATQMEPANENIQRTVAALLPRLRSFSPAAGAAGAGVSSSGIGAARAAAR
jgi:hypothetical protein